MKKTRIIKIIKQSNTNKYDAMIILPIIPFNFSKTSIKLLKKLLSDSFSTPLKILKKKENEIVKHITQSINDIKIKRNFNLLINDEIIKISNMHHLHTFNNDTDGDLTNNVQQEKTNIDNYLKDFKDNIKELKFSAQITHLIFEYEILFINNDDNQ